MPEYGRRFPASVDLAHDYVSYYRDGTAELWRSGQSTSPPRPLAEYGPATLPVNGDPMHFCSGTMRPLPSARTDQDHGGLWVAAHWELDSPLVRNVAEAVASHTYRGLAEARPPDLDRYEADLEAESSRARVQLIAKATARSSVD